MLDDNEHMKDWLLVVWNRRPGAILRKPGMLVMDVCNGHLTPEIEATLTGSSMNTDLVIIPGGMTLQLQVLDVVVNKPFKDHIKQLYSEWLLTPSGIIKKPSVTISLSVDHNSMAECLTRSDCELISRVQWMEMMICCGMTLKRMDK